LIRSAVANSPTAPSALLELLARDVDYSVRISVASNPKAPLSALEMLSTDKESHVRRAIINNPSAPVSLLKELAKDVDDWVAESSRSQLLNLERAPANHPEKGSRFVAVKPRYSLQEIELRAGSDREEIRREVAEDPATPAHVLEMLAKDTAEGVRRSVAKNPATPEPALLALATDSHWGIQWALAENLGTPCAVLEDLARDQDPITRYRVCRNPATPWELLRQLSSDKSKRVSKECSIQAQCERHLLHNLKSANDVATPPDVLLALSSQGYWSVRLAALENPAMPPEAREKGFEELWSEVEASLRPESAGVVPHAITLEDIATALQAMDLMPERGDKKAVARAAKSLDGFSRLGAALSPDVQPSLLRMLLDDKLHVLRQIAAQRLREMETS